MRSITISLAVIIGFLTACTSKTKSAKEVIAKVVENYSKHRSVSYKIFYRIKYASANDTIASNVICKLVSDKADTLFGGCVWYLENDTIETYYNRKAIYRMDRATKKMIDCAVNADNAYLVDDSFIKTGFLYPEKLIEKMTDTTNKVTLVSDKDYFTISINYPDEEDVSEAKSTYWVRKEDYSIDKMTYTVKFQGDYQYAEWNLSEFEFDKVSLTDLDNSIENYKKTYTKERYPPVDIPLLQTGTIAPPFSGTDFSNCKKVSLNDYKGKTVVVDFSYMSCYPCIQAIPHLNTIHQEYKNKNVKVLWLNSGDNNEEDKERLPRFLIKNKVSYPIIMTEYVTDSLYHVRGYPTLYIINKKGVIVYASVGSYETMADTLKVVLDKQ